MLHRFIKAQPLVQVHQQGFIKTKSEFVQANMTVCGRIHYSRARTRETNPVQKCVKMVLGEVVES